MNEELYTVEQAAQYLKVCEKTVRCLISNNKLVASKVGDRAWRIRKDDINVFLREHTNGKKGGVVNE
ncbi:MAG: helix-turn-helix domain-containing protein [Clostridia bacterium]|nr:helix-turn-helix domain-containing protein [Clostridia bacterium]